MTSLLFSPTFPLTHPPLMDIESGLVLVTWVVKYFTQSAKAPITVVPDDVVRFLELEIFQVLGTVVAERFHLLCQVSWAGKIAHVQGRVRGDDVIKTSVYDRYHVIEPAVEDFLRHIILAEGILERQVKVVGFADLLKAVFCNVRVCPVLGTRDITAIAIYIDVNMFAQFIDIGPTLTAVSCTAGDKPNSCPGLFHYLT